MLPRIKYKTLPHFVGPLEYASNGAAAVDLRLPMDLILRPQESVKVGLGLCLDMSESPSIAAMIIPRSGLGSRGLEIRNTVGLIDSDYQGEISVLIRNENQPSALDSSNDFVFNKGDRFCQMLFIPVFHPVMSEVAGFETETERGDGGYGSTGLS